MRPFSRCCACDPELSDELDIVFDAPTKDWSAHLNGRTIDLYLYDIREDMRRRQSGLYETRDEANRVTARQDAPRWFKLSYLVTAWGTKRPVDEHRTLAAVLRCFLLHDRFPQDVLAGSLADIRVPIPYTCALPPPEDRALSDVWSALGGELKPSLDVVVVVPFDLARPIPIAGEVSEGVRLEISSDEASEVAVGRLPESVPS